MFLLKTYLYNSNDGKLYYAGFLIKASIINHNSNFIFQQTKLNKLKELKESYDDGAITKEEYEEKKKKLLLYFGNENKVYNAKETEIKELTLLSEIKGEPPKARGI